VIKNLGALGIRMTKAIGLCFLFIFPFFLFTHCKGSKNKKPLEGSTSPYLLQHLDNPVLWHPWNEGALELAKKLDRPILISMGYASCHWCHVMEEESFMDTAVARLMNDHFICIKIDREERPDIDQLYMHALQLIQGSGGWPANVFALPDGRPFHAVTYMEKNQWTDLLSQITALYRAQPGKIRQQALLLEQDIRADPLVRLPAPADTAFRTGLYQALADSLIRHSDPDYGGLEGEPKFPMPSVWLTLLEYQSWKKDSTALEQVVRTLDAMASGGIYDQLGGGFSRYSTDRFWQWPHFEKMLYDNAQLISLYSEAFQVTGKPGYAKIVRESLHFMEKELKAPAGGYYSSVNADSEGEEGKYYLWTRKALRDLLSPEEFALFEKAYRISQDENKDNVLYLDGAENFSASQKEMLESCRAKLVAARERRIAPATDTKIITSWNALAIGACLDAFHALGDSLFLGQALQTASFLLQTQLKPDGRLLRTGSNYGFLDDYALAIKSLLALYETTFDRQWLQQSDRLMKRVIVDFSGQNSALFYYSPEETSLFTRRKDHYDEALPSSNAVMARNLYKMGTLLQDSGYLSRAEAMVKEVLPGILAYPSSFSHWISLYGWIACGSHEIVILGDQAPRVNQEMRRHYLPFTVYMGGREESLPLTKGKYKEGETTIYVCRDKVCKLPVSTALEALDQIESR